MHRLVAEPEFVQDVTDHCHVELGFDESEQLRITLEHRISPANSKDLKLG
jgi:hypothetical protein